MTTKAEKAQQEEYKERLREILKPGMTVFTNLRHCSASGMSREISLHLSYNDEHLGPSIRDISYWAARAMDDRMGKRGGIKVGGCGMDMGFHIVYTLSRYLFPDGFCVEGELPSGHKVRPTSQAMLKKAIAKGATFRGRNGDAGGWDKDGGYALEHRWL